MNNKLYLNNSAKFKSLKKVYTKETRKKLDNIAQELGSKVDYMTCYDANSSWNKIVIEYNHKLKEKEGV